MRNLSYNMMAALAYFSRPHRISGRRPTLRTITALRSRHLLDFDDRQAMYVLTSTGREAAAELRTKHPIFFS